MAEQTNAILGAPTTADAAVLARRRSPAHDLTTLMAAAGSTEVRLREVPFLTQIAIRAASTEAIEDLSAALGATLPSSVGTVGMGQRAVGPVAAVWLAPDEWLAVLGDEAQTGESGAAIVTSLGAALGGRRGQVVDVSANRAVLELSGPKARAVLDKTVELDLHPASFPVGRAVATVMESVAVILWRSDEDTWMLLPRASFTEHVVRWLVDGMREFS